MNADPLTPEARAQSCIMAARAYPEYAARTDATGIRKFNGLVANLVPLVRQDMRIAAARRVK